MKPHQRVFALLTKELKPLGFERRRTSWWQTRHGRTWHRIHIHKFTFTDSFRVHAAIHVTDLEDDAGSLNGPHSHDGWFEVRKLGFPIQCYDFGFRDSPESIAHCVQQLRGYIERCVLPWFEQWHDEDRLISHKNSPLRENARSWLRQRPAAYDTPSQQ
jgi:hypothetical protein